MGDLTRPLHLIQGKAEEILPTLPERWADVIVTDPPYNEVNQNKGPPKENQLKQAVGIDKGEADSVLVDIPRIAREMIRVCAGSLYVWAGYEQISPWVRAFRDGGLVMIRVGTWTKTNPSPANAQHGWLSDKEYIVFGKQRHAPYLRGYASLDFRSPTYSVDGFPLAKDPTILREMIEASSLPASRVLDPFCGSGTTGIACFPDRTFLGIDQSPTAIRIARREILQRQGLLRFL